MKTKVFLFLALVSVFFHKEILAFSAKIYIKSKFKCEVGYHEIYWDRGELFLEDVVLFDPSFHIYLPKVSFLFEWNKLPRELPIHILIDKPNVCLYKNKKSINPKAFYSQSQPSWLQTNLLVRDGILDFNGKAEFSIEISPKLTELSIDWLHKFIRLTSVDDDLNLELHNVDASIFSFFFPEIQEGILSGKIEIKSRLNSFFANLQLKQMTIGSYQPIDGFFSYDTDGGSLEFYSEDVHGKIFGTIGNWKGNIQTQKGNVSLQGGWDGDKCPIRIEEGFFHDFSFKGLGWLDLNAKFFVHLKGGTPFLPLNCLIYSKENQVFGFDVRVESKTWDHLRLSGEYNKGKVNIDDKSHILGSKCQVLYNALDDFQIQTCISSKAILAARDFIDDLGLNISSIDLNGDLNLDVKVLKDLATIKFDSISIENLPASGIVQLESSGKVVGFVNVDEKIKGNFEGKIHSSVQSELFLSNLYGDLSVLKNQNIDGKLEGSGHILFDGGIESDFDLRLKSGKIYGTNLENNGLIHISFASNKAALIQGLNLHGDLDFLADEVELIPESREWIFRKAQLHLPNDLSLSGEIKTTFDFKNGTFLGSELRKGSLRLESIDCNWNDFTFEGSLKFLDHQHKFVITPENGKVVLGSDNDPMTIFFQKNDSIQIYSIVGSFCGLNAHFVESAPNELIGSLQINFHKLNPILPQEISTAFKELAMGDGYELKGVLKIDEFIPSFSGILLGEKVELFGLEMNSLFAEVDLSREKLYFKDLKISDSGGHLMVDEMTMQGSPYLLNIPKIIVKDLRPSLLHKPGKDVGNLNPLCVRSLEIENLQGILDESNTYTAKGKLHFINSYKRANTVFDAPANIFSRIVGLDLELLIPTCGDLDIELKDGKVFLVHLSNSFSEAGRSEFFLEMDPPPSMDLKGDLQIFVKMKQYVLFKLTEKFLISINGNLLDPEFHLQKKKHFFGLM